MTLRTATLASIVIALIVVACGGEGVSSQEKLARYFQEFERVEAELKEQGEGSGGFDAPRLNADFQSAIAGISPPGEAEVLHDELADALEVYTQVLQDFADRPQSPSDKRSYSQARATTQSRSAFRLLIPSAWAAS